MQNSLLTPIVTKISFPLSPGGGGANPQKRRRHIRNQSKPTCKLWNASARGLSRNRWPNKKTEEKQTYSKTNTSPFALTSEWRVTITLGMVDGNQTDIEADHQEGGWIILWTGVVVHCRKWCSWRQTQKSGEGLSLASTAYKSHELRRRRRRIQKNISKYTCLLTYKM